MSLRVTSEFAGFCDKVSQGFASQLSRSKLQKSMFVGLYVEECVSKPQISQRRLEEVYECLCQFL